MPPLEHSCVIRTAKVELPCRMLLSIRLRLSLLCALQDWLQKRLHLDSRPEYLAAALEGHGGAQQVVLLLVELGEVQAEAQCL